MTKPIPSRSSFLGRTLATALLLFFLGYVVAQKVLATDSGQAAVFKSIRSGAMVICRQGIRVPGLDCLKGGTRAVPAPKRTPLAVQFAQLPNLESAVDKLSWSGGSEVEATRLLTTLYAIQYSRSNELYASGVYEGSARFLNQIWEAYPDLVVGSACYYCGHQSRYLKSQLLTQMPMPEVLHQMYKLNPSLLGVAKDKNLLTSGILHELALIHADLSAAGDSSSATAVGDILIQHQEYDQLMKWSSKGLNGGRSLSNASLDTLPRENVIAAWENGVRIGYDDPNLSQFLVGTGFRPALRWVIWNLSGAYPYLAHSGNAAKYKGILMRYTDFPVNENLQLAEYYSDQWRRIKWDGSMGKWKTDNM